MRRASILSIVKALILSILIVPLSAPVFAGDADLRQQIEQINSAYMERYNKQDAAGVAALYANGGMFVGLLGATTDLVRVYEAAFKGISHVEMKVDQVWPLRSDTALGMGRWRTTGKNQSGAPLEFGGLWTATYVQEAGKWKIRMLTTIVQRVK